MLHNDAKLVHNAYEGYLQKIKIPSQFWKYYVKDLTFVDAEISKKPVGQKSKVIYSSKATKQTDQLNSILQIISNWNPIGSETFCLICSENLKDAQLLLFTFAHYMLSSWFLQRRSYTMEVVRNFELSKLCEYKDSADLPSVVLLPSLVSDLNSTQMSYMTDLFSSSYKIFAATALTPQQFFDRFHYLPTCIFYVDSVLSLAAVDTSQILAGR